MGHTDPVKLALPAALAAICWLSAPVAAAADQGLAVDPQSPTAKQYQLPLEQARNGAAAPKDVAHIGGSRSSAARLFGEGISPPPPSPSPSPSAARSRPRGGDTTAPPAARTSAPAPGQSAPPGAASERPALALAAARTTGGSTTPWAVGIPLAVLLAGCGLGIALRRGSRPSGGS
jgi:hypothetical protein